MTSDENPKVKFCLSVVASWLDRWQLISANYSHELRNGNVWKSIFSSYKYSWIQLLVICQLQARKLIPHLVIWIKVTTGHWQSQKPKASKQNNPKRQQQKILACLHTYTQFTNHIKSEKRLLSWTLKNKHTFPLLRVVDDCRLFSVLYTLSCGAPGIPFYNIQLFTISLICVVCWFYKETVKTLTWVC